VVGFGVVDFLAEGYGVVVELGAEAVAEGFDVVF